MARRLQMIRFHSIRSQIVFYFSFFIIIFAICIAGILYRVLSGYSIQAQLNENDAFAYRTSSNIDTLLSELQSIMRNTVYNENVSTALADYQRLTPYQQLETFGQVQNQIKGAVLDQKGVVGAYLYNSEGTFFYFENGSQVDRFSPRLRELDWYLQDNHIIGAHYTAFYRPDYISPSAMDEVLTITMPVVHMNGQSPKRVGVMALNVSARFFWRATEIGMQSMEYGIAVLDETGSIVFASGHLPDDWRAALQEMQQGESASLMTSDALYSRRESQVNRWQYLVVSDLSALRQSQQATLQVMLLLIVAGIAITVLFAALITARATRSIGVLSRYMEVVQRGNLHAPLQKTTACEEIDQLYVGLANMMERINILIEQNYLTAIREQEAKLESLQAQISPHFLNNTLQMITSLSILGRNSEIEFISARLSSFFSYVIYEEGSICLHQELDYIRTYVDIQNIRYNQKFTLTVDIPSAYLDMKVPKLLLQPMVENALLHGFNEKAEDCVLRIQMVADDDELRIEIHDNGAGIAADRLNQLNKSLDQGINLSGYSIGLGNVCQRLRLTYGVDSRITLESELGMYTTVRIVIPRAVPTDGHSGQRSE